jgi:hypothetical protein
MSESKSTQTVNQSGGVDVTAQQAKVSGDVAGHDKTVGVDQRGQQVIGTQVNVAGGYVVASASSGHDQRDGPQLSLSTDIDLSPPTPADEQAGAKRSWFIRLKIRNGGQTSASNCFGRLMEVIDEKGEHLKQFDSLDLYWCRQDKPDNFRHLDIRENGDSQYLDIAQVKEAESVLTLRVVIPVGHRLVKPVGHIGSPEDLPPGTYHMQIAIYADNASMVPTWFKVEWQSDFSTDLFPCSIDPEKPSPIQ